MSNNQDPCNLKSQYNFAIDEIHFINIFDKALQAHGISDMHYITDTSRNGVTNERQDCANWCNIKGSGLGRRPTTDVADLGLNDLLDALVWIKTPGESDGTSDTSATRHDAHCNSVDSFIPSPEAGAWSADFFVDLCKNANPALTPGPGPSPPSPGNCPGGSLSACMGLCPTDAEAFKACVLTCQKECATEEQSFLQ